MIILVKRLGIFCIYDSEGIIDDYIIYLLNDIKKSLSHLAIICNGKLTPEGRDRLEKISEDIFVRENVGYDMAAWKHGILHNLENLKYYDELTLFNDSFYGPFCPFENIFYEMQKKHSDADFWGITLHGKMHDDLNMCPYGYIPEHIQSYFMVFRPRMFKSPEFQEYWQKLEIPENFQEAIRLNEVCLTKIFSDKGFKYAVYCDTREIEKPYDINIDHTLINTEKLLKEFKCPILKKKIFMTKRSHNLHENYGDEARRSLHFIAQNTNYDLKLIWQNLLRKQNLALTKNYLGLNYILSNKISSPDVSKNFNETVIIAHLYYKDLIPQCVNYLQNVPEEISVIITVNDEKNKPLVEKLFKTAGRKVEVRLVSNRGRDLSALLVGCADVFDKYKYLCFIHDKKSIRPNESLVVGNAFFRLLWDNVLGGKNFICNVLSEFEENPNLGLLVPPPPYNGDYKFLFFIAKYWSGACYESTLKLAEELNIPTKFISPEHSPLALGSVFWCKTDAIKKVTSKNWKIEDFPEEPMPNDGTISHALERIFPFAAQSDGFYTGWLMTEEFAKNELENFIHFSFNPQVPQTAVEPANTAPAVPAPEVSENQIMYRYFLNLTTLECLKFFLQSRIPPKFWSIFRPFKNLIAKLGFKV